TICGLTKKHPFEQQFAISFNDNSQSSSAPALVKLHGSIGSEKLVPPTWQKGLHPEVRPLLQRAHALLSRANHLRVIGYSLPLTDVYVPYLLKAGLRNATNLKTIDVLCLDSDGQVKKRYDDLIDFPEFRFRSDDVRSYLESIASRIES